MPSFDIVSEVNMHEATNAIDQANREVTNRFDFKGSNAKYEKSDAVITMHAESDFQLKQMLDILKTKLVRRKVDIACMQVDTPELALKKATQVITLRQGIEALLAKDIVKKIKDAKLKVQASIQGDKVRVSGKKKDDLQNVIALVKESEFDMPLQFINYRD